MACLVLVFYFLTLRFSNLSFKLWDHSIVYSSLAVASSSAGTAAVGKSAAEIQHREDSTERF